MESTTKKGIAVLCFAPTLNTDSSANSCSHSSHSKYISPFRWWQGHFMCIDDKTHQESSFRLLGTPCLNPPQPHDCWRDGPLPDLNFWSVKVASSQTSTSHDISTVMCTGGDAVRLSTTLDPAVFNDISVTDHNHGQPQLQFTTQLVQVDDDALQSIKKYFEPLANQDDVVHGALVCIGHMEITL
ncbi:hypothetical protein MT418_002183 [Batrachochytrium dendrobatidis]